PRSRVSVVCAMPDPPASRLFPYTTLFRSTGESIDLGVDGLAPFFGFIDLREGHFSGADFVNRIIAEVALEGTEFEALAIFPGDQDRKSTRLNFSHVKISYAVFCLKKKKVL